MMGDIIAEVRAELAKNADPEGQISGKRYFREEIKLYGLKSSLVTKIAKESFKKIKDHPKKEIFFYCEELWKSGFMEESFIACHWSFSLSGHFKPEDFRLFERWLDTYVSNWASCDTFCNHTIGQFIIMYPAFLPQLKIWTKSGNRWVRRGSAVSIIIPARKGKFLDEILEIADLLLPDKDDMVQKGYGWMLKAASEAWQKEIFEYVLRNKSVMPRTALRYAIEKMPEDMRKMAMKRD